MTLAAGLLPAELVEELVSTRRHLHSIAEVGFEEVQTARFLADRLRALGLEPIEGVAGTGLTVDIPGTRPGPRLMLRAEMDAIPVVEQTDVPFRSRNVGAMHACGHDAHMSILLTVLGLLLQLEDRPGSLRVVFQPAEEGGGGAKRMVDDGVVSGDHGVDMVLALHLHGHLDVGTVGVCEGVATAAASEFEFTTTGRGGHGAFPEAAIDPIVSAGHVITALQTVIPREVSSRERAVLSVCTMDAGTAMNVIPDSARLTGTIRAVGDPLHEYVTRRAAEISEGIASTMRCTGEFRSTVVAPSVQNDPRMAGIVREAAATVVGAENVLTPPSVMAGDDLAFFFTRAPGCYFFVGAAYTDGRPQTTHHVSTWDIDERCLEIGAAVLFESTVRYLTSTADGGAAR